MQVRDEREPSGKPNINSLLLCWMAALTFLWLVVSWSNAESKPTTVATIPGSLAIDQAQPQKSNLR